MNGDGEYETRSAGTGGDVRVTDNVTDVNGDTVERGTCWVREAT